MKLFLESKIKVQEKQINVVEGDVVKEIKDIRVVEGSGQQLKGECVELDKEINELWRLMLKYFKRMYNRHKKGFNCLNSLTKEEVAGECNGRLQYKVCKPHKLRS